MFGKTIETSFQVDGAGLVLTVPSREGIAGLAPMVNDPVVTRYLGANRGFSPEQQAGYYEKMAGSPDEYQWGIFLGDRLIGTCSLMKVDHLARHAEYGILIVDKGYWKKGIGTAVLRALTSYGFQQLNLLHIYLRVYAPNVGSWRAAEKMGYTRRGDFPAKLFVDGAYHNEYTYFLSREEWERNEGAGPS